MNRISGLKTRIGIAAGVSAVAIGVYIWSGNSLVVLVGLVAGFLAAGYGAELVHLLAGQGHGWARRLDRVRAYLADQDPTR